MLANRVVSLLFPTRSHKVLPPTPGGFDSVLVFAPGSVSLRVDGLPPPALDKVGTALSAPYPDRVLGLGQGLNGIWLGPPGVMLETRRNRVRAAGRTLIAWRSPLEGM